jgi:hypothetical protein
MIIRNRLIEAKLEEQRTLVVVLTLKGKVGMQAPWFCGATAS